MAQPQQTSSAVYNLGGINLFVNPLIQKQGDMLRMVNAEVYPYGAIRKRGGYGTYLNNPDSAQVNKLFNWHLGDGTTFWNYRASGSILYYSTQGTGNWTVCGNGTFTNGFKPGYTVLEETMLVGDGTAATRHTTNGTSFTNTTSAPIANFWTTYQNRAWGGGTANSVFYSDPGTPTGWVTDSSSITIPGPGRISSLFVSADRMNIGKNSGNVFRYDGAYLIDTSTTLGPTSAESLGSVEDLKFWGNRLGFYAYTGASPEIISNPIGRQVYNTLGSGIAGTSFDALSGVVHYYDYFCSVGTVTDDLSRETVADCIEKYNFQQQNWTNYQFANYPTAWQSFKDNTQTQQLIFGDASGQCYIFDNSTSDNGATIASILEFVLDAETLLEKEWRWIRMAFNPGCEAQVQIAWSNSYTKESKKWVNLGDARSGFVDYHFPQNARSSLLFIRILDSSTTNQYNFYGVDFNYNIIPFK